MTSLRWQFLWLLGLISLGLVALCAITAVSLFRQQVTVAEVLHENVASRRAATELEACLLDILALLKDRVESVSALHGRARTHLDTIRRYANLPEEQQLAAQLSRAFAGYLEHWQAMPPPRRSGHEQAVKEATRTLETDLLRVCQELEQFNGRRIEDSAEQHERVLRQLAWGMASVGGLAGVAGLVLGFGVARSLSRSIRLLQIQIRDAAGKLGHDLPEIVVTQKGNLGGLHEQIEHLTARIETVVQQLRQREHEVLRAEQLAAVGQLAAGVAHEIRNPLTSIKMLVQAGQEDGSAAGLGREDLHVIELEVRRMERSLQMFLDFARPPKPERRPLDVLIVLHRVLGLIRGRADKQRVSVRLDAPVEGIHLTADGEQLHQVLVNLTLNALDAMPAGGILTVTTRASAGQAAEIQVADTGGGISPELMPRLFQPFVSGKDTGLGLGLVTSRRIVENHGGMIAAANRPEGGAVFTVRLPAGEKQ